MSAKRYEAPRVEERVEVTASMMRAGSYRREYDGDAGD